MAFLVFVLAMLMQAADVHGTWEIRNPAQPNGADGLHALLPPKMQFAIRTGGRGNSSNSYTQDQIPIVFRGLTSALVDSPTRTTVHFEVTGDAGTFVCEGTVQAGYGTGTFTFHPDSRFVAQMESYGYRNLRDDQILAMAMVDMSANFPRELRDAGLAVPEFNHLIGMWALGVTSDYVREIQQAGFMPTATDLTGMRALNVTAEFARDVRQLYPNVSLHDLVGMRALGVTVEFAREVRQADPGASIHDVMGMQATGRRRR